MLGNAACQEGQVTASIQKSPPVAVGGLSWVALQRGFFLRRLVAANRSARGSLTPGSTFPPSRVPDASSSLNRLADVYTFAVLVAGSITQASLQPATKKSVNFWSISRFVLFGVVTSTASSG